MAYEPNTIELLSRISAIDDGILSVAWLNITSLPELPETLKELHCSYTNLSVLPKLPETLTHLSCGNTQLSVLPKLPETLKYLDCSNTQLSVLPKLPETLKHLDCSNTPLKLLHNDGESLADYSKRWDAWRAEQACIKRCREKCWTFRDELFDSVEFATFSGEFFLE